MENDGNTQKPREWVRDALGRKPLADYLTNSLKAQAAFQSARHNRGLTVALDADWGSGKTFFVKEWIEDLKAHKHPVVYFDAWENDIGDEASLALMAAVLSGLEAWRSELPTAKNLRARADKLRKSSIAKLRKAVVPVAGVLVKGIIKKAIGASLDELVEAYTETAPNDREGDDESATNATLDKLFEEALVEHDSRKDALTSFRQELAALLSLITEHTEANAPLFVFVDELDRCRPSYAMKLLEEIKHVFGVENVVYVISTNLEQLQNSVKAQYGAEFDGRRYLHRLFDREYSLPPANNRQFANVAVREESALTGRKCFAGLPAGTETPTIYDSWSAISDAFLLDFRTQRQIFELADEAATGINAKHPVHTLWLFFLCSVRYLDMQLLDRIVDKQMSGQAFVEAVAKLIRRDLKIPFRRPARNSHFNYENDTANISRVLAIYFDSTTLSAYDLFHKDVNGYDYPNYIYKEIIAEYGNALHGNDPPPSIRGYAALVRTAGYLTS